MYRHSWCCNIIFNTIEHHLIGFTLLKNVDCEDFIITLNKSFIHNNFKVFHIISINNIENNINI